MQRTTSVFTSNCKMQGFTFDPNDANNWPGEITRVNIVFSFQYLMLSREGNILGAVYESSLGYLFCIER